MGAADVGQRRVLALVRGQWARIFFLFFGVFIPLAFFASLAEDVSNHVEFSWDEPVLRWLHGRATPGMDSLMVFVSLVGMWRGLVPFDVGVTALLLARRQWDRAVFFALAVGGSGLLNVATKQLFARERPSLWVSIAPAQDFSFPSGHAMGSAATVTASVVLLWKTAARWPVAVVGGAWVLLVSASRAYLGVHYPSDLVAAWLASLAWVCGLAWLFHVLSWRRAQRD